jgi:hypothetical protein
MTERENELARRYNQSSPSGFGGAVGFDVIEQLNDDGTLRHNPYPDSVTDEVIHAFLLKMGDATPRELREHAIAAREREEARRDALRAARQG